MRTLPPALLLAPLAACFEPVEPEIDPADLHSGRWELHLTDLQARGDCAVIAVVQDPVDVVAFMEVDDDEVSLWMDGMVLDGGIDGTLLELSGSMSLSDDWEGGDIEDPEPMPSDDDGWGEPGCSDGSSGEDGVEILPACVEPEPVDQRIRVSIDADILAADLIRGELSVRIQEYGSDCLFESELVGIQVDGSDGRSEPGEPVEPQPYEEPVEDDPDEGDDHSEEDPGEEEPDRD